MADPNPQPPYPLNPAIEPRVHPSYRDYYNKHIINQQQVHYQPISASRASGVLLPGGGALLPVGETQDYWITRQASEGPDLLIRVFVPEGEPPVGGWPVCVWFHGGGWVLGNVETENNVCTELCKRAGWVVVSADYRLAPESPYPAAIHDAWETLLWTQSPGPSILPLNPTMTVLAGSSAGANLAAYCAQRALSTPTPAVNPAHLHATLLNVPVLDNTATTTTSASWKELEFTPALPAAKMLWYRRHYLPDPATWAEAGASPLLWDGGVGRVGWGRLPWAVVVVGELDVLRGEGEAYVERVREAGGRAECHVMEGMPHPFLAMSGVLEAGRRTISVFVDALREVGKGSQG